MSIVWMDGFEDYSSANGLLAGAYYAGTTNIDYSHDGRFGGKSLGLGYAAASLLRGIPTTAALSVGFAYNTTNSGNTVGNALVSFLNADGTVVCCVVLNPSAGFTVKRGSYSTGASLGSSNGGLVFSNVWNYIEVEFTRHASAGAVNIYVNGALVLSLSGVNTGADDIVAVGIASGKINLSYFDDYYITDTATRIGECKIDMLVPNADTAQKDFTPLSGVDNFAMVDELPVDGDTSYVTADTTGSADLYATAGLADTPSNIYAVQARVWAKKTDTGIRSVEANIKSGASLAEGTPYVLSTGYSIAHSIHEVDPATSAAWTKSGVDAAQVGMELA